MIFIIGAGLNGLAIGCELVGSGQKVRIYNFEQKGESSLAAVGMLAPLLESKPYEKKLFLSMLESKKKWEHFANNLFKISNIDVQLKNNSSLIVACDNDDLERLKFRKKYFDRLGYKFNIMSSEETRKLEPNLSPNIVGSVFCEGQDQVNPILLKKSLKSAFIKLGGEIVNEKVDKLFCKKNKIGIYYSGTKQECSHIVITTGVWSRNLMRESFGIDIPVTPLKGVTLTIKSHKKKN